MLTPQMLKQQSLSAYNQWAPQWRQHAKHHSKYAMKPLTDFENIGVGRAALCIANGASFEREIETIKKYQGNVDIIVCDKALGHCLDHGIKPDFLLLADANVKTEKYLAPWKDQLGDTVLLASVSANPEWADLGNWKDRYFFTLMDVLGSEKEFGELSGCSNVMPAGTNVSNAQVVMLTQSDNTGRKNFFGYDKILLIGFDYCWMPGKNYYAFDADGGGKHNYMRHIYARTIGNELCYTSTNLAFSSQWLDGYVKEYKLPVVQCSKDSVLGLKNQGALADHMQYAYKTEDAGIVQSLLRKRTELVKACQAAEAELKRIGRDHYFACAATL